MERAELQQLKDLIIKYNKTYDKPYPTLGNIELLLIVNDAEDKVYG